MAELDISKTTTTTLSTKIDDYSVAPKALDFSDDDEYRQDFPKAAQQFGYLKTIPELNRAVWALATWVVGKGFEVNAIDKVITDHINGWGKDSFQNILENLIVVKKICGDAFAEIIRDEKSGNIINIKPISPERMSIIVGKKGRIKRYEYKNLDGKGFVKLKPEQVLHISNDRTGDEVHGNSILEVCQWVIDARNEALTDWRKVLHRNVVPVRIIEIDTDNATKRDQLILQYEEAIKKGEVLVIPKGTVSIADNTISIQDPITWIQYLENFFYIAVGIPRVIATSQEYTEAASKVGYLTFEPVYTKEQLLLEQALWQQASLKIKLNRPASLSGTMQEDEAKNTGQIGFQPKDVTATLSRE